MKNLKKATRHLNNVLGGNLNTKSLTPRAFSEKMEDYLKNQIKLLSTGSITNWMAVESSEQHN